jgi:hypothetical protein
MPSVPSERIAKGSVLRKVDDAINTRNAAGEYSRRAELLSFLQAIQPAHEDQTEAYLAFLRQHIPGITPEETDYLRHYFFSRGADSLWREHPRPSQPIEPVVRHGLIKALAEANTHQVPLDSYWMTAEPAGKTGGGQDIATAFETIIICSAYQVTRLIYTPSPTAPPGYSPLMNDAPIFLCKQSDQNIVIRDLLSPHP